MSSIARTTKGRDGEDLACRALERRGYVILERRFRTRFGELDVVASDAGTIVFIEVKARWSSRFGNAAEAVTWHKRRRIVAMAREYVHRKRLGDVSCRFDVVAVDRQGGGGAVVTVIAGAFDSTT